MCRILLCFHYFIKQNQISVPFDVSNLEQISQDFLFVSKCSALPNAILLIFQLVLRMWCTHTCYFFLSLYSFILFQIVFSTCDFEVSNHPLVTFPPVSHCNVLQIGNSTLMSSLYSLYLNVTLVMGVLIPIHSF